LKYLGLVSEEAAKAWLNVETNEIVHYLPDDDGEEEWWQWSVLAVAPTRFGARLIGRCMYPETPLPR